MRNSEFGITNEKFCISIIIEEQQMSNPLLEKSKAFALQTIKLYKYLAEEKHEYILSKQILRSGTSIGANIREATRGQTAPMFYSKMNISLGEAEETAYWLELIYESDYISKNQFESLYTDIDELIKLLVAITKNQKGGQNV